MCSTCPGPSAWGSLACIIGGSTCNLGAAPALHAPGPAHRPHLGHPGIRINCPPAQQADLWQANKPVFHCLEYNTMRRAVETPPLPIFCSATCYIFSVYQETLGFHSMFLFIHARVVTCVSFTGFDAPMLIYSRWESTLFIPKWALEQEYPCPACAIASAAKEGFAVHAS